MIWLTYHLCLSFSPQPVVAQLMTTDMGSVQYWIMQQGQLGLRQGMDVYHISAELLRAHTVVAYGSCRKKDSSCSDIRLDGTELVSYTLGYIQMSTVTSYAFAMCLCHFCFSTRSLKNKLQCHYTGHRLFLCAILVCVVQWVCIRGPFEARVETGEASLNS